MMRLAVASILLAGVATAATAQAYPYGNEGGCARHRGEPATTDAVTLLTRDRVENYESSCEIVGSIRGDGSNLIIQTLCSGEGENWYLNYEMQPLAGEDGFRLWASGHPDFAIELRPCQ